MKPYTPTCPACRTNDMATFYKACQGCQARRAQAMQAFHAAPGGALPAPSTNGPSINTWRPKDGAGWRTRGR